MKKAKQPGETSGRPPIPTQDVTADVTVAAAGRIAAAIIAAAPPREGDTEARCREGVAIFKRVLWEMVGHGGHTATIEQMVSD